MSEVQNDRERAMQEARHQLRDLYPEYDIVLIHDTDIVTIDNSRPPKPYFSARIFRWDEEDGPVAVVRPCPIGRIVAEVGKAIDAIP